MSFCMVKRTLTTIWLLFRSNSKGHQSTAVATNHRTRSLQCLLPSRTSHLNRWFQTPWWTSRFKTRTARWDNMISIHQLNICQTSSWAWILTTTPLWIARSTANHKQRRASTQPSSPCQREMALCPTTPTVSSPSERAPTPRTSGD